MLGFAQEPGGTMDRPANPMKPDSGTIWPTIIVAIVLGICLAAGIKLLANTRAAWERNQQPSPNQITAARVDAETKRQREIEAEVQRRLRAQTATRSAIEPPAQNPNFRCINGQLFRRLPNGWENVPGERCK